MIAMAVILLASCGRTMETIDTSDLMSDTWVATDGLGRQMPLIDSVGQVKTDHKRVTGIFYITWHGAGNHNLQGPYTRRTPPPDWMRIILFGNMVVITGESLRWAIS